MYIPSDPVILLSYINTKLRDDYSSFDALCDDLDLEKDSIEKTLKEAGYAYDGVKNQFI